MHILPKALPRGPGLSLKVFVHWEEFSSLNMRVTQFSLILVYIITKRSEKNMCNGGIDGVKWPRIIKNMAKNCFIV